MSARLGLRTVGKLAGLEEGCGEGRGVEREREDGEHLGKVLCSRVAPIVRND